PVASGAGHGLPALRGVLSPIGALPTDPRFGAAALGLAFVAITAGLLSSTFHLGQPRRAWRAFSQWRSSWLSREGVAALVTYVPAGLFALAWCWLGMPHAIVALLGALSAVMAAVTVTCTAMIYRSLKPIRQWHNAWVVPNYLLLAAMTGVLWLAAVVALLDGLYPAVAPLAAAIVLAAAGAQLGYWRSIDADRTGATLAAAPR